MPGLEAHEQLSALIADVYELTRRVHATAPAEEVRLRVEAARLKLDTLDRI